jgi:hypothetical protein
VSQWPISWGNFGEGVHRISESFMGPRCQKYWEPPQYCTKCEETWTEIMYGTYFRICRVLLLTNHVCACYNKLLKLTLYASWRRTGKWSPIILNVGTRWRSLVTFVPQALYLCRDRRQYPLIRRPAGTRTGLDTSEKRKIACSFRKYGFRTDRQGPCIRIIYNAPSICNVLINVSLRTVLLYWAG